MPYDYIAGAERVKEILNNEIDISDSEKIPKDESKFTFSNGYYVWVTAIFVDIRNSSELFSKTGLENKKETAKLVRAFTSEIIEILRCDTENMREIGIRGDCVYAIYTTPLNSDILECADKCFYINTYLNMLNQILLSKHKSKFKAGIGMATSEELIIKAGRERTNINSKVWIGDAVSRASNLSSLGESEISNKRLFFSSTSYSKFIDQLKKRTSKRDVDSWFTKHTEGDGKESYNASIIKTQFDEWYKSEM